MPLVIHQLPVKCPGMHGVSLPSTALQGSLTLRLLLQGSCHRRACCLRCCWRPAERCSVPLRSADWPRLGLPGAALRGSDSACASSSACHIQAGCVPGRHHFTRDRLGSCCFSTCLSRPSRCRWTHHAWTFPASCPRRAWREHARCCHAGGATLHL